MYCWIASEEMYDINKGLPSPFEYHRSHVTIYVNSPNHINYVVITIRRAYVIATKKISCQIHCTFLIRMIMGGHPCTILTTN